MRVLALALFCGICSLGQQLPSRIRPDGCTTSWELLKYSAMDLGVRLATSNPELALQFQNAMNFWAGVIDMRWHLDDSSGCSIELVDGKADLFTDSTVARAHLAEESGLAAWIAFNPKAPLTDQELYCTAAHEIGHLIGLEHNPNVASLMYYTNGAQSDRLDETDLQNISERHKLRDGARLNTNTCAVAPGGTRPFGAPGAVRRRPFSYLRTQFRPSTR
jgi:hypothetical protein